MGNTAIPNFSDLVENKTLDGEKMKLEEALDRPIVVTGFRISKSKYAHKGTEYCTTIQFYFEDDPEEKRKVIFTGSGVIHDQIEEIGRKLDETGQEHTFRSTIRKCGNYHALT